MTALNLKVLLEGEARPPSQSAHDPPTAKPFGNGKNQFVLSLFQIQWQGIKQAHRSQIAVVPTLVPIVPFIQLLAVEVDAHMIAITELHHLVGFAIGLQVAHPDRRVVHLTGDGAMGFHIQEFDTMVRHNLPIVTVVFNNGVWGMSIHGQQLMYGANYNIITQIAGTRYADIAAAFGCHAERVDRLEDVGSAMERAFASGKPAMVEIMVDADVVHPVTASMLGQIAEGSSDVMIPYYENIPAEAT